MVLVMLYTLVKMFIFEVYIKLDVYMLIFLFLLEVYSFFLFSFFLFLYFLVVMAEFLFDDLYRYLIAWECMSRKWIRNIGETGDMYLLPPYLLRSQGD